MQLRIFNNLSALTDPRPLGVHNERLSNTPGQIASENSHEEAAATALSARLRSDTHSLQLNAQEMADSLARVKVTQDALQGQSDIIIRLRELATKAATENISQAEREAISLEFDQLRDEFEAVANSTELNLREEIDSEYLNSSNLEITDTSIATSLNASSAMDALAQALDKLNAIKTSAGSLQARLEKAIENLNVSIENRTAAASRLSSADIASELTHFTRDQILAHSAKAVVGQANLIPQGVFELIEGL